MTSGTSNFTDFSENQLTKFMQFKEHRCKSLLFDTEWKNTHLVHIHFRGQRHPLIALHYSSLLWVSTGTPEWVWHPCSRVLIDCSGLS